MRRRPPTATKPMPVSGALALASLSRCPRPRPILRQLLSWIVSLRVPRKSAARTRAAAWSAACVARTAASRWLRFVQCISWARSARMMRRGPYDPTFTTAIGQSDDGPPPRCDHLMWRLFGCQLSHPSGRRWRSGLPWNNLARFGGAFSGRAEPRTVCAWVYSRTGSRFVSRDASYVRCAKCCGAALSRVGLLSSGRDRQARMMTNMDMQLTLPPGGAFSCGRPPSRVQPMMRLPR